MCGIVGGFSTEGNAVEIVIQGLQQLAYRGYDSWGVGYLDNQDQPHTIKKLGRVGPSDLKINNHSSRVAAGHTRWATHGAVTFANAHPQSSTDGRIMVFHNGMVDNYDELSEFVTTYPRRSETDTEIIALVIEHYLSLGSDCDQAVRQCLSGIQGHNAILILDGLTGHIYAAKVGMTSPLFIGRGPKGGFASSDGQTLLPITDKQQELHHGQIALLAAGNWSITDFQGDPVELELQSLRPRLDFVRDPGLKHKTLQEIMQQPQVIDYMISHPSPQIGLVAKQIKAADLVVLTGCGTAAFAAEIGADFIRQYAQKIPVVVTAGEFDQIVKFLTPHSVVIAVSQSGSTAEVIDAVAAAKERGSHIIAMTNTIDSAVYLASHSQIDLHAGHEIGVCSTKAYTAMVLSFYLLAKELQGCIWEGYNHLSLLLEEVEGLLSVKSQTAISHLANSLIDQPSLFLLGRATGRLAAMEGALKVKEVSYTHAEDFAIGELKHGVFALLGPDVPCLVYAPTDSYQTDTFNSISQMRSREARVIGVSNVNHPNFSDWIKVENQSQVSVLNFVIVSQLLGYYMSVAKGLDPDTPRNLAKSVTVK